MQLSSVTLGKLWDRTLQQATTISKSHIHNQPALLHYIIYALSIKQSRKQTHTNKHALIKCIYTLKLWSSGL